jgi:predicted Zn-dependent protease with MMP-like domain
MPHQDTAATGGTATPPTLDDIAAIGQTVLDELPPALRRLVGDIPIRVQDWPEDTLLDELGIEDALDLTGFYHGVPIGERGGMGVPPSEPEMIFLYRKPILLEWCERGTPVAEVVFDVLTHEIGHHLGMNEEDVLRMEGRLPDRRD